MKIPKWTNCPVCGAVHYTDERDTQCLEETGRRTAQCERCGGLIAIKPREGSEMCYIFGGTNEM